jgi:hypothetical protein
MVVKKITSAPGSASRPVKKVTASKKRGFEVVNSDEGEGGQRKVQIPSQALYSNGRNTDLIGVRTQRRRTLLMARDCKASLKMTSFGQCIPKPVRFTRMKVVRMNLVNRMSRSIDPI